MINDLLANKFSWALVFCIALSIAGFSQQNKKVLLFNLNDLSGTTWNENELTNILKEKLAANPLLFTDVTWYNSFICKSPTNKKIYAEKYDLLVRCGTEKIKLGINRGKYLHYFYIYDSKNFIIENKPEVELLRFEWIQETGDSDSETANHFTEHVNHYFTHGRHKKDVVVISSTVNVEGMEFINDNTPEMIKLLLPKVPEAKHLLNKYFFVTNSETKEETDLKIIFRFKEVESLHDVRLNVLIEYRLDGVLDQCSIGPIRYDSNHIDSFYHDIIMKMVQECEHLKPPTVN